MLEKIVATGFLILVGAVCLVGLIVCVFFLLYLLFAFIEWIKRIVRSDA